MTTNQLKQLIQDSMKGYQEQTCGNFSDLNDDMDDVKGHFIQIEATLNEILQRLDGIEGKKQ